MLVRFASVAVAGLGLHIVQGDHFIQLERRRLHHINSHVAHTIGDDDKAPDLMNDSDDDADFDDNNDSMDEDDSEDEEESVDEDDCENSSDGTNPIVSFIRNCLNNYLVVFRCSHCAPQQQTLFDSSCRYRRAA